MQGILTFSLLAAFPKAKFTLEVIKKAQKQKAVGPCLYSHRIRNFYLLRFKNE